MQTVRIELYLARFRRSLRYHFRLIYASPIEIRLQTTWIARSIYICRLNNLRNFRSNSFLL